jgi:hypothetical protein
MEKTADTKALLPEEVYNFFWLVSLNPRNPAKAENEGFFIL